MGNTDKIIEVIENWVNKQDLTIFEDFIVFGSIIDKGGQQFSYHDYESDIDIIAKFSSDSFDAIYKKNALSALRKNKLQLEHMLIPEMKVKNTETPLVSILPLLPFEIKYRIHKSNKINIFVNRHFKSLKNKKTVTFETEKPLMYYPTLTNLYEILVECQEIRHKYLNINSMQESSIKPCKENEIFPKYLSRETAKLANFLDPIKYTNPLDLNNGTFFLQKIIEGKSNNSEEHRDLFDCILSRAGRGNREISEDNILLISEMLYDETEKAIRKNMSMSMRNSMNLTELEKKTPQK